MLLTCIQEVHGQATDWPDWGFCSLPQSLHSNAGIYLKLGLDRIVSYPSNSLLTNDPTIRRYIVRDTDSVLIQTWNEYIYLQSNILWGRIVSCCRSPLKQVVTLYAFYLNYKNLSLLSTEYIYGLHMILIKNGDYLPKVN
jgi:hypothetical protein